MCMQFATGRERADGYKRRARNTAGSRRDGSPEQPAALITELEPARVRPRGSLLSVKGSLYGFATEMSPNCPNYSGRSRRFPARPPGGAVPAQTVTSMGSFPGTAGVIVQSLCAGLITIRSILLLSPLHSYGSWSVRRCTNT